MPSEPVRKLKPAGRRSHTRFMADTKTLAHVGFQEALQDFKPDHVGLVVNESFTGCAAVFRSHPDLQAQRTCTIKCGELDPMRATICRVQQLDSDVIRLAFEYLS